MSALNGVWTDIYILQIIIQKEVEKVAIYMEAN